MSNSCAAQISEPQILEEIIIFKNELINESDAERIFEILRILKIFPITVDILAQSRIGREVNRIRKTFSGRKQEIIRSTAKELILKWRNLHITDQSNSKQTSTSTESNIDADSSRSGRNNVENRKRKLQKTTESERVSKMPKLEDNFFKSVSKRDPVFIGKGKENLEVVKDSYYRKNDLKNLCNVESIPFEELKPALIECSAEELQEFENTHLSLKEHTDSLWELLCKRNFKNSRPQESENWRDLFSRMREEHSARFNDIKFRIKLTQSFIEKKRQCIFLDDDIAHFSQGYKSMLIARAYKEIAQNSFRIATEINPLLTQTHLPLNKQMRTKQKRQIEENSSGEFCDKKKTTLLAKVLKDMKHLRR